MTVLTGTREPGNGLPKYDRISIRGGMLVVEFIFADIGDRAIALSEIGGLKFTTHSISRQSTEVQKQGDYIDDGNGGVEPNPAMRGSIDLTVKRHKGDNIREIKAMDFYFTSTRAIWETILNCMSGAEPPMWLAGERGIVIRPNSEVVGSVSK